MAWPGARRSYGFSCSAPAAPGQVPSQPLCADIFGDGSCDDGDYVAGPTPLNAPSGYAVLQVNLSISSPVLPNANPAVGAFIRSTALPPGAIGDGPNFDPYVPAYVGDRLALSPVGGFAIGRGAIGHLRAYHGTLVRGAAPIYPADIDLPWPVP